MKNDRIKISKHASDRMRERRISVRIIALAIANGEAIREDSNGDVIRYRLPMLIDDQVVAHLNVILDDNVVVTCYVRGCL